MLSRSTLPVSKNRSDELNLSDYIKNSYGMPPLIFKSGLVLDYLRNAKVSNLRMITTRGNIVPGILESAENFEKKAFNYYYFKWEYF